MEPPMNKEELGNEQKTHRRGNVTREKQVAPAELDDTRCVTV